MFLDVDKFKRINDRYGHLCGNLVLERIGNVLIEHTRVSDIKCRYGDEFVVVLPESNHEGIRTMAEKQRYVTQNELYDFADQPVKVTVSVGVSVYEVGNHQSAKSLLNVADLALLSAKQAGGNCVVSKNVDDRAMRDIVPNTVGVYRSSARDYLGQ